MNQGIFQTPVAGVRESKLQLGTVDWPVIPTTGRQRSRRSQFKANPAKELGVVMSLCHKKHKENDRSSSQPRHESETLFEKCLK
jgi:hypothetical protein